MPDNNASVAVSGSWPYYTPSGSSSASSEIFLHPETFMIQTGTPAMSSARSWQGWYMDAASTENIVSQTLLPSNWSTFHVDLVWTAFGNAGNVVHQYELSFKGNGDTLAATSFTAVAAVAAPADEVVKVSRLATGAAATAGKFLRVSVGRVGGDAGDTLAQDTAFLGVLLTKAS